MKLRATVEPPPVRCGCNAASGYSLQTRNGSAEYPGRWTKSDKALSDLAREAARKTWVPDHAGGAMLVCFRIADASKLSGPMSVEDARRIDAERAGGLCGGRCDGQHAIVYAVPGRLRVEMGDPPRRRRRVVETPKHRRPVVTSQ